MTHYNSWPLGQLPESWQRPEPAALLSAGIVWDDPRDIIEIFEHRLCEYSHSNFAVLTDCCTNALFLALKYKLATGSLDNRTIISIPKHTYVSVPMAIHHAGLKFKFDDRKWQGEYELGSTGIFDSAARFTAGMARSDGSIRCLSFQIKKRLPIGRGGALLVDSQEVANWLKLASYDGRDLNSKYDSSLHVRQLGWHMYMTPEDAARGILLLGETPKVNPDTMSWDNYPDLTKWKAVADLAVN